MEEPPPPWAQPLYVEKAFKDLTPLLKILCYLLVPENESKSDQSVKLLSNVPGMFLVLLCFLARDIIDLPLARTNA